MNPKIFAVVAFVGALGLAGCGDAANEASAPVALAGTPGVRYTIVGVGSGKCLDVATSGGGASVRIATCSGIPRQAWRAEQASDGSFRWRNAGTDLCLDVADRSTSAGAHVVQQTCGSATSQQLRASDQGDGMVELIARHSGLVLDVSGAGTSDGTPLIQWARTGRSNQRFRLVPIDAPMPSGCAAAGALAPNPFGCELAWGTNGNGSPGLDFVTTWVGYEPNGGLDGRCDGCGLVRSLASSHAIPTYYAYFIGFQASAAGFGDCNTDSDGQNLCNRGAAWLRQHGSQVVSMYGNYARMTREAGQDARVLWLLDGDFIQYTYPEQSAPFSLQELGDLTAEIVCAIKSNQPGAIVALNHSSWLREPTITRYFDAMPMDLLDLVWTTGVGDADGYLNTGDAYGRGDGSYAYLRRLTGKNLFVDTSFGASQQADSWTNVGAGIVNARIADGVIAVNVTSPPSDYAARIAALAPSLRTTCR